jgi:hypothetical protein
VSLVLAVRLSVTAENARPVLVQVPYFREAAGSHTETSLKQNQMLLQRTVGQSAVQSTIHCDRAASGRMVWLVDLLNNAVMDGVHSA